MNKCWLLMGGNMGDRMAYLNLATIKIGKNIGRVLATSKTYESEAWGVENQNNFLNKIIVIETKLSPDVVLRKCLEIEVSLGRIRAQKWTERTIDIDIIFIDNRVITTENLTVPHPEVQNRKFALLPLCEVSPEMIHPTYKISNIELLKKCTDKLNVWEYK